MTALECGLASRPLPGESVSGDLSLVRSSHRGILAAVVDGLGHGDEAAAAAALAVRTLEHHAGEPLFQLLNRCHRSLSGTRGVVMSLAEFNPEAEEMTWLGVGNVEGVFLRGKAAGAPPREPLLLRSGVVGENLPPLMASIVPIMRGDTLVFATDGIEHGFLERLSPAEPPQKMADRILASHARKTDDALVLVARYVGYAR